MQRKSTIELKEWIEKGESRIAYIYGPEGVGKTWIAINFAESFFEKHVYINLETDFKAQRYINSLEDNEDILEAFSRYLGLDRAYAKSILFIFDEISYSKILIKLIQNSNNVSELPYMLLIDSYNTIKCETDSIRRFKIRPLDYDEFLMATGHEWYKDIITAHAESFKHIPMLVHNELLSLFDLYIHLGGMPSVINEYLDNDSLANIEHRQLVNYRNLIGSFSEFLSVEDDTRGRQIYNSAPYQLIAQNGRFKFSEIRKGVTYKYFEKTILELMDIGCICLKYRLDSKTLETGDKTAFEIIPEDIGYLNIAGKKSGMDEVSYRELMYHAYISNTLINCNINYGYWESGSGSKIEHIIYDGGKFMPIELSLSDMRRGKNIAAFQKRFGIPKFIRITDSDFEITDKYISMPVYSLFCSDFKALLV